MLIAIIIAITILLTLVARAICEGISKYTDMLDLHEVKVHHLEWVAKVTEKQADTLQTKLEGLDKRIQQLAELMDNKQDKG